MSPSITEDASRLNPPTEFTIKAICRKVLSEDLTDQHLLNVCLLEPRILSHWQQKFLPNFSIKSKLLVLQYATAMLNDLNVGAAVLLPGITLHAVTHAG